MPASASKMPGYSCGQGREKGRVYLKKNLKQKTKKQIYQKVYHGIENEGLHKNTV